MYVKQDSVISCAVEEVKSSKLHDFTLQSAGKKQIHRAKNIFSIFVWKIYGNGGLEGEDGWKILKVDEEHGFRYVT
jgi:hypothetical protein